MRAAIVLALVLALVGCGKKEDPNAGVRPQLCVKAFIVDVYEEGGVKTTLLENVDVPDMEPKLRFQRRGVFGSKGDTFLLCEYS